MADINPVTVQSHIKEVDYPANKQELLDKAPQEGASPEVCSALEKLPADRDFQSAADVTQALGQIL